MTTLLISLGPCHRCGGQMRDSVDGPHVFIAPISIGPPTTRL